MTETGSLIADFLQWKVQSHEALSDRSRRIYARTLEKLAERRGPLLRVTAADLIAYQDASRHLAASTRARQLTIFNEFFRFAHETRRVKRNPALGIPRPERLARRVPVLRQWAGVPKRDLLRKQYRPIYDFLREVWGRNPELNEDELWSIRAPGGAPEIVRVGFGPRRGAKVVLSPRARWALNEMGGAIPLGFRAVQREFERAYRGAVAPRDLRHLPPPGFTVDLHVSLEGEVRELLVAGRVDDAARRAFVQVDERIADLARAVGAPPGLYGRPLINHVFAAGGPFAAAIPSEQLEPLHLFVSGSFGLFRNRLGHGTAGFHDENYTLEVLQVADVIMRFLDTVEAKVLPRIRPATIPRPKIMAEARLRSLGDQGFERWAVQAIGGTPALPTWQNLGIDGFTIEGDLPIQVKRRDRVQRDEVDRFETAVERYGATRGILVAFSFTAGATTEVERIADSNRVAIELVTAAEVLDRLRRGAR